MATVSRGNKQAGGTNFTANTTALSSEVNTDFNTLYDAHNNHDSGTSKHTVVSAENASSTVIIANNSTGTNDIIDLRDNGSSVLKVADGGNVTFTGKQLGPNGTAAAPTYSFSSTDNGDNGLYLAGDNNPAIAAGGTKRLDVSTTAITAALPLAMGSNKITGLAAGTANGDAVRYEQVIPYLCLQTLFDSIFTQATTTSSTFQATNMSISLTPTSASSIFILMFTGEFDSTNAASNCEITFRRDGTNLGPAVGFAQTHNTTNRLPGSMIYHDAPATTSSVTYDVAFRSNGGNQVQIATSGQCNFVILEFAS